MTPPETSTRAFGILGLPTPCLQIRNHILQGRNSSSTTLCLDGCFPYAPRKSLVNNTRCRVNGTGTWDGSVLMMTLTSGRVLSGYRHLIWSRPEEMRQARRASFCRCRILSLTGAASRRLCVRSSSRSAGMERA